MPQSTNTLSNFLQNLTLNFASNFPSLKVSYKGGVIDEKDLKMMMTQIPAAFISIGDFEEKSQISTRQRITVKVALILVVRDKVGVKGFKTALDLIEEIYRYLPQVSLGGHIEDATDIKAQNFVALAGTQVGLWAMTWKQKIRL